MNEHSDNATIRRTLPGQLFYSTQIPVCLWFLAKNKNADAIKETPLPPTSPRSPRHGRLRPRQWQHGAVEQFILKYGE